MTQRNNARIDPTIIAALIGVCGTITVAVISVFANRLVPQPTAIPTWTFTSEVIFTPTITDTPVPTDTVPPGDPTSTPAPETPTLEPTFTSAPPTPPPIGADWINGCISTLWMPYPASVTATERGDGCWKEPVHVFSAENGDLDFLVQRRNAPVEIYGLFAPLPERGTVTFRIRLRELTKADLWMGIFAEPNVTSEGLLMIIPPGDVKKRVFVQKDPFNYETIAGTSVFPQGNGFSISFQFTTNSARSTVNPSVFTTSSVSIPSAQKWLFLGYKGLGGTYRVDGTFLSFELK